MNSADTMMKFIQRHSFIELDARGRAQSLLDEGSSKELAGPFSRMQSPWLPMQGVAPQSDDGCVVLKGKIDGKPSVVISLEGKFQGGSIGEVSGAKICAALDLATRDSVQGTPTPAILLLETGGVRLQEANLGLAAVAEVIASVLSLRPHVPVITIIAGTVGCFGGMSLVAGISSYVLMTREARLGLNGPEVIEQESGVDELDSKDRALIWAIDGGEQRVGMGLADVLVEDSVEEFSTAVRRLLAQGVPAVHRSELVDRYRTRIEALDVTEQIDPAELRAQWKQADAKGDVQ